MAKSLQPKEWKGPCFGPVYARECPSEIDWARLAAFIDGEGSILINPRSRKERRADDPAGATTFYLKVTVANTDVRLLEWIKYNFGGNWRSANTEKYNAGRNVKPAYHWTASSGRAAWILFNCHKYFIIKKEQADLGIELQETMSLFVRGTGATKRLPEPLVVKRRDLKKRLLILKARGKTLQPEQAERIAEVS